MESVQGCFERDFNRFKAEYSALAQKPLSECFLSSLEGINSRVIDCAKRSLFQYVPELFSASQGIALVYTGSDSRLEKCGLGSPLECILVTPQKSLSSSQKEIICKVLKLFSQSSGLIYSTLDRKGLDQDFVSTYDGSETRVIPTRAFDAQLIAGDESTFIEYKKKLYCELSQSKVDLKKFRDFFLKTAFQSLRQELSGSPRKNPLLVLDSGKVYYEQKKGRGLKHDILRVVQYSIASLFFKMIQENQLSVEECMSIPSTIVGRLKWLETKKKTPLLKENYDAVVRNYVQTSYWYVQLNDKVIRENAGPDAVTVMELDSHELRRVVGDTNDLCKVMVGG